MSPPRPATRFRFRACAARPYSRRMKAVALAGLVIYTLGAYAYGALAAIWLREDRRRKTLGGASARRDALDFVTGLLVGVSGLWFCGNALQVLLRFARLAPSWLDIALICSSFAFPP